MSDDNITPEEVTPEEPVVIEEVDKPAEFDIKDSEFTGKSHGKPVDESLTLLLQSAKSVIENIDTMKAANVPGSREHLIAYQNVLRSAILNHPQYNSDIDPFDNVNSLWRSKVEVEGREVGPYRPQYSGNGALSGDMAIIRARESVSLGTQLGFPFWRTGIWLKLRAPSDITLLELERRVAMEKIALGRTTLGAALTSTSIYMQSHVVNTLLNHVVDGSASDLSPTALKKTIRIPDVMPLINAWACTIWPDAYPIMQPCVKDPNKCSHIVENEIFVNKLFKTNNRLLSKRQRNSMLDREANNTAKDLEQYDEEHQLVERTIKVSESGSIVLHVPTLYDMEQSSYRWVDNIVTRADEAFGQELRGEERNRYISEQGMATTLRRFGHWIKEVQYDDGATVTDIEGIEATLDVWSSIPKVAKLIKDEISKFNREVTITAIGFARYECPKCKGEAPEEISLPHLPEVIPIDPLAVFFTLQHMKVQAIRSSET